MTSPAPARPRFAAPRVLFWLAFGLRLLTILIGHTYRVRANDANFDFGFEAGRIAQSLVGGHGYGNPFNGISGPSAWLPPLYPLLVALAFRLFGIYSRLSAFAILAANSLFSALIVPAVYEIAARCFDAPGLARRASRNLHPVALWSACLWAVYPAALQYAIHWIWEMSLSACLFSWVLVLALRLRGVGDPGATGDDPSFRPQAARWARFGLLWGLLALSNASLLSMLPASILWVLWPSLRHLRLPALIGPALASLLFLATLSPWVLRNQRALGSPVLTRSNFGVELWQSAHFAAFGPFPWGTAMPLWPGDPEFQRYIHIGEIRYAAEKGIDARARIRRRPDLFVHNTLLRAQFFWFGVPHATDAHPAAEFIRVLDYSFLSVAGLLGLALALRRHVEGAGLFALAFGLIPLVYYGVTVQARFRHPLEPLIAILAVYLFRSTTPRRLSRPAALPSQEGLRSP